MSSQQYLRDHAVRWPIGRLTGSLTRRRASAARRRRGRIVTTIAVSLACVAALVVPGLTARAASSNLVANPSVERAAGVKPAGWLQIASGSNARQFRYLYSGAADGRRFVRTTVSARRTGYAGWGFAPVKVVGGASYTYGDRYRSNTRTVLRARYVSAAGKVTYRNFSVAPATRGWNAAGITFTIPRGTVRMSMERLLTSTGLLDVDNTLLRQRSTSKATPRPAPKKKTAPPATRPSTGGVVSITFDDGFSNMYTNARPVLQANKFPATFYLIANYVGAPSYMTVAQVKALQGDGHEIGGHSATHANLTTLSGAAFEQEIAGSKTTLEANFGPIKSLAYPYGAYNASVKARAGQLYQTARTTDGGVNVKGNIDRTGLKMRYVTESTSAATVATWMKEGAASGTWTILLYHAVAENAGLYAVTPAQFASHMSAVKSSGLRTMTVSEAYAAMN